MRLLPRLAETGKLRGGLVPKAIERVLEDSSGPMRARDIHTEVEELLGMSVPASSVKTGWPSRLRMSSPESCAWDAGGIGWPDVLLTF